MNDSGAGMFDGKTVYRKGSAVLHALILKNNDPEKSAACEAAHKPYFLHSQNTVS